MTDIWDIPYELWSMCRWGHVCYCIARLRLLVTWWRHQMETFSALLSLYARNSPVTGEFPTQRPVTLSFDAFFGLRLSKRLSKQSRGWWFETPSCPLWRHCNERLVYMEELAYKYDKGYMRPLSIKKIWLWPWHETDRTSELLSPLIECYKSALRPTFMWRHNWLILSCGRQVISILWRLMTKSGVLAYCLVHAARYHIS